MSSLTNGTYTNGSQAGVTPSIGATPSQSQSNPGPNTPVPSAPTVTSGTPLALSGATTPSPTGSVMTPGVSGGTPSGQMLPPGGLDV